MKRQYQLLSLAAIVLAAYYPSSQAGVARVDDVQLFQFLGSAGKISWKDVLLPAQHGGYYYRPIIVSSFLLDRSVLGLLPGLMHMENILLHVLNSILVYFLTLHALRSEERARTWAPLASGLLFGLHPIATESVNWISGRTDVLAASFVLLSALMLLIFRERRRPIALGMALACFLCAVLTKETLLAFLPGFALILTAKREDATDLQASSGIVQRRRALFFPAIGLVGVALMPFVLRYFAFRSNTGRVGLTILAIKTDWIHSMFVVLRAFGFYLKKLIVPIPLNFAILEVDPLYEIVAVPLVALCIYVALRRTVRSAVFAAGICLILPAFIPAFSQIAWTPYAERYIYVASSFLVIASVLYVQDIVRPRRVALVAAVVLIAMMVTTFLRCNVWKDDFLLVQDTVEKSPLSRPMRGLYAAMLAEKGEYDRALVQVEAGSRLPYGGEYDAKFDVTKAYVYAMQGKYKEAERLYRYILLRVPDKASAVLPNLITLQNIKLRGETLASERMSIEGQRLRYNIELYMVTRDPYLLYKIGNDAIGMKRFDAALNFYRDVLPGLSDTDPRKAVIKKRIGALESRMGHAHGKIS